MALKIRKPSSPELRPAWISASDKTFAEKLRPLVSRLGGATKVAGIVGYARQTVNSWLRDAMTPHPYAQAGILLELQRAAKASK